MTSSRHLMLKLVHDIKAKGGLSNFNPPMSSIPELSPPHSTSFTRPSIRHKVGHSRVGNSERKILGSAGPSFPSQRYPQQHSSLALESSRARALPAIKPEHSCIEMAREGDPLRLCNINIAQGCGYALYRGLEKLPWSSKDGVWLRNLCARKQLAPSGKQDFLREGNVGGVFYLEEGLLQVSNQWCCSDHIAVTNKGACCISQFRIPDFDARRSWED
jgi:hypothetical protein